MFEFYKDTDAIVFKVRVVPNSSKSEIVGEFDGALKIKIAAPPVDDAANAELIKFLAKKIGAAKNSIEIIGGQNSKNKLIKISDSDLKTVSGLLK